MAKAGYVYSDQFLGYCFSRTHPLQQVRLQMNKRLLEAYGMFDSHSTLISPVVADESDILRVHTAAYVKALRQLSENRPFNNGSSFGLGEGDNPAFQGMYPATLLYVGATKEAVRHLIAGENSHVFNCSGGLHHAMPGRAGGFCLANDCSLAALWLKDAGYRPVYLDIDAHHGDGVQHMFYSDPSVLTISLHERPETLFPHVSGFVGEFGSGDGVGYNANVPLYAGSTDEHYEFAFDEVVDPLIASYKPTAIVLNVGADGHFEDPLTHLALSSHGWVNLIHRVLRYGVPIVAVGGGGYNLKTVARLWTLLQAALSGVTLDDNVPGQIAHELGINRLHDINLPSIPLENKNACWENVRAVAKRLQSTVLKTNYGV